MSRIILQELEKRVKEIEYKYCRIVEFLSKHDKDDLVKDYGYARCGSVLYLYNGELKDCELPYLCCDFNTIENKKESAIIEINTFLGLKTIWKLDKSKNVMVDITREYKPKNSTEDKNPPTD